MFLLLQLTISRLFKLQSIKSNKYIGRTGLSPIMVDQERGSLFRMQRNDNYQVTLCTRDLCFDVDNNIHYNQNQSSTFSIVQSEDNVYSFRHNEQCIVERGMYLVLDGCADDRFKSVYIDDGRDVGMYGGCDSVWYADERNNALFHPRRMYRNRASLVDVPSLMDHGHRHYGVRRSGDSLYGNRWPYGLRPNIHSHNPHHRLPFSTRTAFYGYGL